MGFVVLGPKVFEADVGVFLCRCGAGVPEQFLDRAQVGAAFE